MTVWLMKVLVAVWLMKVLVAVWLMKVLVADEGVFVYQIFLQNLTEKMQFSVRKACFFTYTNKLAQKSMI